MDKERTLGDSIEQYSYGRAGIYTGSGIGNVAGFSDSIRKTSVNRAPPRFINQSGSPAGLLASWAWIGALVYFATGEGNFLEAGLKAFAVAFVTGIVISAAWRTAVGRFIIRASLWMVLLSLASVIVAVVVHGQ